MNDCTCGLSTEVACWLHKDDCPFYCPEDEFAVELDRCRRDPTYFFGRYCKTDGYSLREKAMMVEKMKRLIELRLVSIPSPRLDLPDEPESDQVLAMKYAWRSLK